MKKYLLLIILLLVPFVAKAEAFEYTIKSKVTLEGKELEGEDFTFDLLDSNGTVIQTTTNDQEGNIIFNPITFTAAEAREEGTNASEGDDYNPFGTSKYNKYIIYLIKQRNDNKEGYTYDEEIAYVGVYIYRDGTSKVDYLKNLDEIKKETTSYKTKEGSEVFHATEEQLQGQAYAVLDYETGILTFFRDTPNKYTDFQQIGNKTYYTNFEEEYKPTWLGSKDWYMGNNDVKKIVFQDPIKPKHISDPTGTVDSWFAPMQNLEEIENLNLLDTSEVTRFSYICYNTKLKELDLSTWDTSSLTTTYGMFDTCRNLEEVYMDNFDFSHVTDTSYMFTYSEKIKWLNSDIFDLSSLERGYSMFLHADAILGIDTSKWNIRDIHNITSNFIINNESIIYVNASNLPAIYSEGLGGNPRLAIIDLAGEYNAAYTNYGPWGAYWYNIKNHTIYNTTSLRTHLTEFKDLEPATYVRPNHNPEPSLFRNSYKEAVDEKGELIENLLENPTTKDGVGLVLLITLLVGLLTLSCYKKYKFYN